MTGIALDSWSIFGQVTRKPKSCRNLAYTAGKFQRNRLKSLVKIRQRACGGCSFFRAMKIPYSLSDFFHTVTTSL
jgi:hypothetical protein